MKKIANCFCCSELKRLTEEHIIPQSLGGRLSAWIYCKECNDTFGRTIEAELINNFRYFSTALKVDRIRGKNQPYNVTLVPDGMELTFDGKEFKRTRPVVDIKKDGDKVESIQIIARSSDELEKITLGFKRKYSLGDEFETKTEFHPGPIDVEREFVFDNSLIRRAVSKIAYGLICTKIPEDKVFSCSFNDIRNYIRFGAQKDLASANFRNTGFLSDNVRPLHKIHISFNRRKKLVIGFVCLFGIFKYTTLLSKDFNSVVDWADLDYTFDPTTGNSIYTPNFLAPDIEVNDVLSPKHSKQLVIDELRKGHKILSNYIDGYHLLEIEDES
jgi:hypothetical protein